VFLNLKLINKHGISYRPQLATFEDMIFGKECEEMGLKVLIWNRVNLVDVRWNKTGCKSPYVTPQKKKKGEKKCHTV
jgi:hypothetical protein